jgi:hypothetical protein
MFRAYWREPRFWLWWFKHGAPAEVRVLLGVLGVIAVLGGGYLAADRLSQANAGVSPTSEFTYVTTVNRNVTVREDGKTIVRRVPVVHRVLVHPQTMYETRLIKAKGQPATRYVPVVKKSVVTVAGKQQIRTRTVFVPTPRTQTQTVTSSQTIVRTATESTTVVLTQTLPAQIVTATHTVTEPVTITQSAVTLTSPIMTMTVTVPGL